MAHEHELPFTYDSLRSNRDGLGFGGDTKYEENGIKVSFEEVGDEVHVTIEGADIVNLSQLPDKWVVKIAQPVGPPELQAIAVSSNNLGTNVLKHG